MKELENLRCIALRLAAFDLAHDHAHTLSFLCGAVYSLQKAVAMGWDYSYEAHFAAPSYREHVREAACDLAQESPMLMQAQVAGELRSWLGGLHYNSGLMRVLAAADTLDLTAGTLRRLGRDGTEHPAIGRVRNRVNYLKHELDSKLSAPLPTLAEVCEALEVVLAKCEAIGLIRQGSPPLEPGAPPCS